MLEKLLEWLTKDLLSARSVISYLIYGAAVMLWVQGKEVPGALFGLIGILQGFYFGTKRVNGSNRT